MKPTLQPGKGSLDVSIDISHTAVTPPGMEITVEARVEKVDGKRIHFFVVARDDLNEIGRDRHGRAIVRWDRFNARVAEKAAKAGS